MQTTTETATNQTPKISPRDAGLLPCKVNKKEGGCYYSASDDAWFFKTWDAPRSAFRKVRMSEIDFI